MFVMFSVKLNKCNFAMIATHSEESFTITHFDQMIVFMVSYLG